MAAARPTPPLTRLYAYPVTAGLGLLAAVVTTLISARRWDIGRFEMIPGMFPREAYRLVLTILPHQNLFDLAHAGPFHLIFNLMWLWALGTKLEETFGPARLLGLVLVLAVGASAAEYALFSGGVGLSGVVYGLFGLTWVLSKRDRRFDGAVTPRMTSAMVGWFFFCILLTALKVKAIANVAHGMGALLGVCIGFAVAARSTARRALAAFGVLALTAASIAGASTFRTRVNLERNGHPAGALGYEAIQAGRFPEAVALYREAVALDPKTPSFWFNLGIAYRGLDESLGEQEILPAFRRAHELDRHDFRYRAAYLGECRRLALSFEAGGAYAKAVPLREIVVDEDPADVASWSRLVIDYRALGRLPEAEAAGRRVLELSPPLPTP